MVYYLGNVVGTDYQADLIVEDIIAVERKMPINTWLKSNEHHF